MNNTLNESLQVKFLKDRLKDSLGIMINYNDSLGVQIADFLKQETMEEQTKDIFSF